MSWKFGLQDVILVRVMAFMLAFNGLTCLTTLDVGGSSVPDTEVHQLSNISLRWMVHEVMKAQCGVQFDDHALSRAYIHRFNFLVKSENPDEEQRKRDMIDALEPIHDQLQANRLWWLLEITPTSYSWQDDKGVWHKEWGYVLCWLLQFVDV